MQNLQQTVTIKGLLTFDNGFGDIINEPICVSWLEYRFSGAPPMVGFVPCEDFPALLRKAEGRAEHPRKQNNKVNTSLSRHQPAYRRFRESSNLLPTVALVTR
jgi:hypothetical protein